MHVSLTARIQNNNEGRGTTSKTEPPTAEIRGQPHHEHGRGGNDGDSGHGRAKVARAGAFFCAREWFVA